MKKIEGGITAPQGFVAAGVKSGIKKSGKEDVALIVSQVPAAAAAVFTQNKMAAAPVLISRENAAKGKLRAIVVNSGCANACTGERGLIDARLMVTTTANLLGIAEDEVLVSSTGVIGVTLPMDKVLPGIEAAAAGLSVNGHEQALHAIMTTDTFPKVCAYELTLGDTTVKIGGVAKGAGMIHPNMATMLSYVTTDAAITAPVLQQALNAAVNKSFNMITIDGDTSTNDTLAVLANGLAKNSLIDNVSHPDYAAFCEALTNVLIELAKLVVRDGEGATKFLEVNVSGAASQEDAKTAAMAVAKSPLVKTAFFGEDPNWGRILCAVGYSGAQADPARTSLRIGGIPVVSAGLGVKPDLEALRTAMSASDIVVEIELGIGDYAATVWTCDFSYDYVKINAEYHT
ncbi:ornithine acetyltransferase [Anaerosporomusa subterranea]|jgi:glutamate N-acetyltransferase/amino-acid N-acetyltransferase|uniref:Arginine biosynthesis bifunctional protein ArgJ n=2 Tax=Anaerosporomusa subterranea TaxID=1794912 RepID=A0A154BUP4_ANASB|nr:ornithine acetyltransferase [Anaerosporomusa subterranea]MDF2502371.1 argJ [Anaerosporomusa subterranea]